jgi:hypothetical protein
MFPGRLRLLFAALEQASVQLPRHGDARAVVTRQHFAFGEGNGLVECAQSSSAWRHSAIIASAGAMEQCRGGGPQSHGRGRSPGIDMGNPGIRIYGHGGLRRR